LVLGHTIRAQIEGMEFTLFYDYDQLQDGKLSRLTDAGKIDWFRMRMDCVFLDPLRSLFDVNSRAFRELNSDTEAPFTYFGIAAFSILLNGVEALGSFLPTAKAGRAKNRARFVAFIQIYMKPWDVTVAGTSYATNYLPDILWMYFRNGIAHSFVIKGGGIDPDADATRHLVVQGGHLEIGPNAFFTDFIPAVQAFSVDIGSIYRASFLQRFREVYPC
jgi:hypothetical protein